jgi:hypothetical protein
MASITFLSFASRATVLTGELPCALEGMGEPALTICLVASRFMAAYFRRADCKILSATLSSASRLCWINSNFPSIAHGASKYVEEKDVMQPTIATRIAADAMPTSMLIRRKFPRPALNSLRKL